VSEDLFRSFSPDLAVRSGGDGRTIYGIAVPWRAPVRIDSSLVEQWAPGAFNHQAAKPNRIRAAREHIPLGGTLIGALTMMRSDPAGQYIEFRVSKTPVGEETLELVRDGALTQLSVGFRERQNRRLAGGVVERVKADMFEVAVTMEGAYGDLATAAGVRSAGIGAALSAVDVDLRAQAEEYLLAGGLPELPDNDLQLRQLRLGLPF
jgi:uncharacterized protein